MTCMKCGREIKDQQVFCDECLGIMDTYPVKPGTPILLPTPPAKNANAQRSSKKRQKQPEEQIRQLKSSLKTMTNLYVLTLLAFLFSTALLVWFLCAPEMILGILKQIGFF